MTSRLSWALALVLGLVALIPFVAHCAIYLGYPFSLDETEGYLLGKVDWLERGGRLYMPLRDGPGPYLVDNYPPAFPVTLSVLEQLAGPKRTIPPIAADPSVGPQDERSVGVKGATLYHDFRVLRGFVAVLGLGLLGALIWSWRRGGVPWALVGAATVMLIAQPPVFFMMPLARADWGALCCGMIALVLANESLKEDSKGASGLWWAIGWGVLALSFRQSALAPLVAIGLTLFLKKDKRAVKWSLSAMIGIAALAVALTAVYGPEIWTHLVVYTRTRFLLTRLAATWGFFLEFSSLYLLLAGLAWWWVKQAKGFVLPVVYAPLASATALLAGKVGSDMNYFLEALIGGAWMLGFGMSLIRAKKSGDDAPGSLGSDSPAWTAVAVCLVLLQGAVLQNPRAGSYRPDRFDLANGVQLLLLLQRTPEGPVVSEEEGIVALAGRPVWLNPFIVSELAREGLWNESGLVSELRQGTVRMVIAQQSTMAGGEDRGSGAGWDRFTPAMQRAITEHYRVAAEVPFRRDWLVWVPTEDEKPAQ